MTWEPAHPLELLLGEAVGDVVESATPIPSAVPAMQDEHRRPARPRPPGAKAANKWLLAGVLAVVAASFAIWRFANRAENPSGAGPGGGVGGPRDAADADGADRDDTSTAALAAELQIPDDGRTLWASPTDGEPLSAAFLPPGTQGILAVRLADLIDHPDGERILSSAGPHIAAMLTALPARTGMEPHEVSELVVGLRSGAPGHSDSGGAAQAASLVSGLVLRLTQRVALSELAERLAGAEEALLEGQPVVLRNGDLLWLPAAGDGRILVMTTAAEDATLPAAPPPLRREIELLLASSDAERHITLIMPPSLLLGDGREVLAGQAAALAGPLQWLLGRKTQAVRLAAHWGDDFFLELAAIAAADLPPLELRLHLADRLEELPGRVEDQVLSMNVHPYGRRIVARLPEMLRRMVAYTRSAANDEGVVFRCYLPSAAGHNLLMAAEIALAEYHAGSEREAPPQVVSGPQSAHDRLAKVTSLSFSRDTLEGALALLADDVGVPIHILGADLQVEGITKNQSLGLDMQDRPAREILTEILRLANPDKTATGPADQRQMLVYVIRPDEAGVETIYVTTRKAADPAELPAEFRPQ